MDIIEKEIVNTHGTGHLILLKVLINLDDSGEFYKGLLYL